METLQVFVLFLTFACALGGLLLAFRVERRVTKMFGKGDLKGALLQFFSNVPDAEGNEIPPQAAFYAFCSGIATDCTERVLEDLPGALASLGGKSAATKAAKTSAFARGAQNLSAGGFGELQGIKTMAGDLLGKVGSGFGAGGKGGMMDQVLPMIMQKVMSGELGGAGGATAPGNGAPPQLPQKSNSQSVPTLGKPM